MIKELYNSPVYFLADCHLPLIVQPENQDLHDEVIRFLREKASQGKTLFLVGDIFDFWFEWRLSIPSGAFRVLSELKLLVQNGIEVIYLGGNHDGHVGRFLEEQVNITVSRKPVDVIIDEKKFHILHGDGVAPPDRGYRFLRRLVRWKRTEKIYRLVHPDLGIWFANKVSKYSRQTGGNTRACVLKYYQDYAMKKLEDGFNYTVMGHIHEAEYFPHPNGGFYLIGDWMQRGCYGVFENGKMKMEYFPQASSNSSDSG